jgi:uncharacterized surface protein with fasciclin (FAS1) repeats
MQRLEQPTQLWSSLLVGMTLFMLLSACDSTVTSQGQASPTAIAAATATTAQILPPTATTAANGATATGAPPVDSNTARPNDVTQARLRVSPCLYGAPDMDIYLDGKVPVAAGIPLSYVSSGVTRYEYLLPGTHSVAVVPEGKGITTSQALLPPLDVMLAAGHRYTLVVLGQQGDPIHKSLLIDETAAYQAIGAKPTDLAHITVNNLKGAQGIDQTLSGVLRQANIPYGGFQAAIWPAAWTQGDVASISGAPGKVLVKEGDSYYYTPGLDSLDCWGGKYPGLIGSDYDSFLSPSTSVLNTIDFLQGFTNESAHNGAKTPSFSTFLSALKKAGLAGSLTDGNPYLVFAPTDKAFAALPKDKLDAIISDPKALSDLLRRHIVEGYYPPATLATGRFMGYFDRTVTNLLGEKLTVNSSGGYFALNGEMAGGGDSVMTANGTRVFYNIDTVLLTGAK